MSLLTKEQILKNNELKYEIVSVPEWGGDVRVSTMSGFARDRFELSLTGNGGKANMDNVRAKLAAASITDENGKLLFTEHDIKELGLLSCSALDKIFAVAQRLNVITNSEVEALAKNS